MPAVRFEESEKEIKKEKASGANKQLGGCWFILVSGNCRGVVPMWRKNRSVRNSDGTEIFIWHLLSSCVCGEQTSIKLRKYDPIRWSSKCCLSNGWSKNNQFDIVVEKGMSHGRMEELTGEVASSLPFSKWFELHQDSRNQTHGWKELAVPCSGRMLTLKSSSWLRALMRSNSSWTAWGQSVISWRHALGGKQDKCHQL